MRPSTSTTTLIHGVGTTDSHHICGSMTLGSTDHTIILGTVLSTGTAHGTMIHGISILGSMTHGISASDTTTHSMSLGTITDGTGDHIGMVTKEDSMTATGTDITATEDTSIRQLL